MNFLNRWALFAGTAVLAGSGIARADVVSGTVTTVSSPSMIAVDTAINMIYVAGTYSSGNQSISIINGATNSSTSVYVGRRATGMIAVNPLTNMVYAPISLNYNAGYGGPFLPDSVAIFNGLTNSTAHICIDSGDGENGGIGVSNGIAVNPVTNMIYMGGLINTPPYGGVIYAINGSTNAVTTINVPDDEPTEIEVNPLTNKIYMAGESPNISIINGSTNEVTNINVGSNITEGLTHMIAVNPVTNKIYVANNGGSNIIVIDGQTNDTTILSTIPYQNNGFSPRGIAVNPVTNMIYVLELIHK